MSMLMIVFAAIELVYPAQDSQVKLVPEAQRAVLAVETREERGKLLDTIRAKKEKHDKKKSKKHSRHVSSDARDEMGFGRGETVVFRWKATAGEDGPWEILIGKKPDLSDARQFLLRSASIDSATGREIEKASTEVNRHATLAYLNLEIATRYYWKVTSNITCGNFGHGRVCRCKNRKPCVESAIGSFTTEDQAPRWIKIEGRTANYRDLGGRIGVGGKRVRQGMIFRSQGFNDNSIDGIVKGPNRLTVTDIEYLTGTLGIRTDLDIRGNGEVAGLNGVSPLGKDVRYVHRPSSAYRGIFEKDSMKVMAANFREFCNIENYPITFHCIGGADRAGSLAYVLNGALGVKRQELETDWESTFYPNIPDLVHKDDPDYWCRSSHFTNGFMKYGNENSTWTERIELYLKACGITDEELAKFRSIMLCDK